VKDLTKTHIKDFSQKPKYDLKSLISKKFTINTTSITVLIGPKGSIRQKVQPEG